MGGAAVAKWARLHQAAGVCPQAYCCRCANLRIAGVPQNVGVCPEKFTAKRGCLSPEVYGDFDNVAKTWVSPARRPKSVGVCPQNVCPQYVCPQYVLPRLYVPKRLRPSAVSGGVRVFHSENVGTCPHTALDRKLGYLSPAMVPPRRKASV